MTRFIKIVFCFVMAFGLVFKVQAETLPIFSECNALSSTDLSTQMANEIDSRISGVTASDSTKSLFSARGNGSGGWTRSSTVWTNNGSTSLDFTGASPWNVQAGGGASGGYVGAGTLISPRHMVLANHSGLANGSTVIFVDSSNNIVTRTISSQMQIGSSDIQLALLDSAVPSSITYYPIIDFDAFKEYVQTVSSVPIIILDQEDKALIKHLSGTPSTTVSYISSTGSRANFDESLEGGDSGNPIFAVVGGRLVLISTIHQTTSGPFHTNFVSEINSAMTTLGGGYQVADLNLSCFTPQPYPVFTSEVFEFDLAHNSVTGSTVGTVTTTGAENVTYTKIAGNTDFFNIHSSTGVITVADGDLLSQQAVPSTKAISIQADTTSNPWKWPLFSTATVNVDLIEQNVAPVFSADTYNFSVSEVATSGASIGTISATDQNISDTVSYSITSGNSGNIFNISSSTGAITLANGVTLDYDVTPSYTLTVQAIDNASSPLSDTATVNISVTTTGRPNISFSGSSTTVSENVGSINVPISLSGTYLKDVSVNISNSDGTALENTDYTLSSNSASISAGSSSANFSIAIVNRSGDQSSRSFTITLSSASKANIISPSIYTITITNVSTSSGGGGGGSPSSSSSNSSSNSVNVTNLNVLQNVFPSNELPVGCAPGYKFNVMTGASCPSSALVTLTTNALQNVPTYNNSVNNTILNTNQVSFTNPVSMRIGMKDDNVKNLQKILNTLGYNVAIIGPGSKGNETSFFGPATKSALIKFQKANNLTPDGIFGPKTRSVVNALVLR